jgi:hypothetical protein
MEGNKTLRSCFAAGRFCYSLARIPTQGGDDLPAACLSADRQAGLRRVNNRCNLRAVDTAPLCGAVIHFYLTLKIKTISQCHG